MVNPLYDVYNFYLGFFDSLPYSIKSFIYLSLAFTIIASIIHAVNH